MGKEEKLKQADNQFRDFTSLITDHLSSAAEEIKDEVQMALCDLSRQFGDHQDITEARFKDILRLYGQLSNQRRSRRTWSPDRAVRLRCTTPELHSHLLYYLDLMERTVS